MGLVVVSVLVYAASFSALGVMFWQFSGDSCPDNNVILALTLVFSVLATVFQLCWNEHYSLLTSAVMCGYAVYVCYAAITLNPDHMCNGSMDSGYQTVSSAIGMGIMVISLTWATYTAGLTTYVYFFQSTHT